MLTDKLIMEWSTGCDPASQNTEELVICTWYVIMCIGNGRLFVQRVNITGSLCMCPLVHMKNRLGSCVKTFLRFCLSVHGELRILTVYKDVLSSEHSSMCLS